MSCPVILSLGPQKTTHGVLSYSIRDTEVLFSFVTTGGDEIFRDRLASFPTISVDDDNPLKVRLEGRHFTRELLFLNEADSSNFWHFLRTSATVTPLPGHNLSFSVTLEADLGYMGLASAVGDFGRRIFSSTMNTMKTMVGVKPPEPTQKAEEVNGFTLGYITRSVSDVELVPFSEDMTPVRFSMVTLTKRQMMAIWMQQLVGATHSVSDYRPLVAQWSNVSKSQWDHSIALRTYVVAVEGAIRESACRDPPLNLLVFHVLMSIFSFRFMKFSFQQDFITILEVMLSIFVGQPLPDSKFETNLGEVLSFEETSSLLFWSFKSFIESFLVASPRCKIPSRPELFLLTKPLLSNVSPSSVTMLEAKKITGFEFCDRDISGLFLRGRSREDAQRFLTALICAESVPQFIECTLCTILVLLQGRLEQVENEEMGTFKALFETLLPSLSIRLILCNVERLTAMLHRTEICP
jgi:hypothetical protein